MLQTFLFNNLSTLIVFVLGSISFPKLNRPLKLFYYLIIAMVAVEGYAFCRSQLAYKPNHWTYHIYMIIEFALFMNVFKLWQVDRVVVKLINYLIPTFTLFCLANYFFWSDPFIIINSNGVQFNFDVLYNFWPIRVACVFYTAISAYTLYILLKDDKGNIIQLPAFWISSGLLIFASGSIVFFIGVALHRELNINPKYMVIAFSLINVISHLLYAVGFWMRYRHANELNALNQQNYNDS